MCVRILAVLSLSFLVAGCSLVAEKRMDISDKHPNLVGKTIVVNQEMFLVSAMGTKMIYGPLTDFLPTMAEYKKEGKTYKGLFPDYKITGLLASGEKLKVLAIEEVVNKSIDRNLIYMKLLREKDNTEYETQAKCGIFYNDYKNTLNLCDYVKIVGASQPAAKK